MILTGTVLNSSIFFDLALFCYCCPLDSRNLLHHSFLFKHCLFGGFFETYISLQLFPETLFLVLGVAHLKLQYAYISLGDLTENACSDFVGLEWGLWCCAPTSPRVLMMITMTPTVHTLSSQALATCSLTWGLLDTRSYGHWKCGWS